MPVHVHSTFGPMLANGHAVCVPVILQVRLVKRQVSVPPHSAFVVQPLVRSLLQTPSATATFSSDSLPVFLTVTVTPTPLGKLESVHDFTTSMPGVYLMLQVCVSLSATFRSEHCAVPLAAALSVLVH